MIKSMFLASTFALGLALNPIDIASTNHLAPERISRFNVKSPHYYRLNENDSSLYFYDTKTGTFLDASSPKFEGIERRALFYIAEILNPSGINEVQIYYAGILKGRKRYSRNSAPTEITFPVFLQQRPPLGKFTYIVVSVNGDVTRFEVDLEKLINHESTREMRVKQKKTHKDGKSYCDPSF